MTPYSLIRAAFLIRIRELLPACARGFVALALGLGVLYLLALALPDPDNDFIVARPASVIA